MLKKRILATILLLVAIIISYIGAYQLLKERTDGGGTYQFECFYKQPKDSVDVLFVGSSRVFCNIEPSVLWRDYGISSYDLATNSQRTHLSYYAVKEALKYQRPKVVVLEVSRRDYSDKYEDEDETMSMQNGMRFSINKMQALFDYSNPENRMDYLLGLPCYHSRYRELSKESFMTYDFKYMFPVNRKAGYKGGVELFNITGFEAFADELTIKEQPATEQFLKAMDGIKEECDKHGVKLLLLNTPHIDRTEYTCVKEYAKDNNIPYLNCNEHLDELGMVAYEDFADEGHLNYLGASKVSDFLGKYLKDNYDLSDHRGDVYYSSWDENLSYVNCIYKDALLKYQTGMGDYFNDFPDDDYLLVVSLVGNYKAVDNGQKDVLAKLGCSQSAYDMGGTFVIDGKDVIYYATGDTELDFNTRIERRNLRLSQNDDGRIISFDNINYQVCDEDGLPKANGIEVIVYDKRAQKVADAVMFDSDNDYLIVREKVDDPE